MKYPSALSNNGYSQPEEDESKMLKNEILIALNNMNEPIRMIEKISNNRNDVISMWKRATKIRYSREEEDDVECRRIEQSSWRVWFKQRQNMHRLIERKRLEYQERQIQDKTARVLHRVSSYINSQSPFKAAHDLGDYFQEIGTSMNYNPDICELDRPISPNHDTSSSSNGTFSNTDEEG